MYTVEQETVFPHAMAGKSVKYLLFPTLLSTGLKLSSSCILRKLVKIGILFQRIDVTSDYFNVMFFCFCLDFDRLGNTYFGFVQSSF